MHVYQLGWHWEHPETLAIERPNGHFGLQIILVRTKGCLCMDKKTYHVEPNTLFLVESCLPHCIYAEGEPYVDDWIRFSVDPDDAPFMESLHLPFNVPIRLPDESVSQLIRVGDEIFRSGIQRKNETLSHILRAILSHVSACAAPRHRNPRNHYDKALDKLKRDIYDNPAHDWNVTHIAEHLSLSPSHFQRLYKQRFGVSCMNDVFISRMHYAGKLLLETEYTAKEIAFMCGYQSYENFSRAFTKFACVSPVQYRAKFKET